MDCKQCIFWDKKQDIKLGGILIYDGEGIICAECGGFISPDEIGEGRDYEIVKVYNDWVDFSTYIIEETLDDDEG